jgi:branched-chain amino acid transport system ATP-binding protein
MTPLLEVREISHAFGGLQALRGVSFDLARQEILGIIGPNGAGKSTLFAIIAGYIRADRGKIVLAGSDITRHAPERVARAGLVKTFQTSRLFPSMTFLENVTVGALARGGAMAAARVEALHCLDRVGLADKRDTPARGASTGQRKRLEIARALATRPTLLLVDEPFGGVDAAAEHALIELLQTIRADGVTVLVIEHNLDVVHRLVDRLIALNRGEIIAEGRAEEVTADPRVIQVYLGEEGAAHA